MFSFGQMGLDFSWDGGSAFGIFQLFPFPSTFANPKSLSLGGSSLLSNAILGIQQPALLTGDTFLWLLSAHVSCKLGTVYPRTLSARGLPLPSPVPVPSQLPLTAAQAGLLQKPCFGRSRVMHKGKCWGRAEGGRLEVSQQS